MAKFLWIKRFYKRFDKQELINKTCHEYRYMRMLNYIKSLIET